MLGQAALGWSSVYEALRAELEGGSMKAMVVREAGGPFELEEREIPEPGPGQVRIKVEACGICHSDAFVKFGQFPGLEPRANRYLPVLHGAIRWLIYLLAAIALLSGLLETPAAAIR